MTFSVTIPSYKAKFLYEAIDSVLKQTYDDFELIIVDDCSPEDLRLIVDKFSDSRIRYYRNEKNCGAEQVVDNWNICLGYCTGEWVICMGDDDMLMPNCLEEYAKAIQQYPSVDLLHARVRQIDEKGDLITILSERPQFQSAYSSIYFRIRGNAQYIGDFCFRINRLRKEGGFFKLPFAWGSDDISAFICASPKGVANINIPTFCYRINRYTISNSCKNEKKKLEAAQLEEQWLINYVKRQTPQTELEREELKSVNVSISGWMEFVRYCIVKNSLDNSLLNLPKVLFHKKKYHISYRTIVKALFY